MKKPGDILRNSKNAPDNKSLLGMLRGSSEPIQKVSKGNFELLKTNSAHPSLHFKKIGKLWSIRAGMSHRAIAVENGEDFIWVWIGTHDEYERMIKTIS